MTSQPRRRLFPSPTSLWVRASYLSLVLMLVLAAALLVWAVHYPTLYQHSCVEYYIPSAQKTFGFRVGRVRLEGTNYKRLAVVEVTPGGALSRAGFRPGDIPVGQHGGEIDFCTALQGAEAGYTKVDVINVMEWRQEGRRVRRLEIPQVQRYR